MKLEREHVEGTLVVKARKGPGSLIFCAGHRSKYSSLAPFLRLPAALTEEQLNGQRVIRALYRFSVEGLHRWGHLREIWHVKQTTIDSKNADGTLRAWLRRA